MNYQIELKDRKCIPTLNKIPSMTYSSPFLLNKI